MGVVVVVWREGMGGGREGQLMRTSGRVKRRNWITGGIGEEVEEEERREERGREENTELGTKKKVKGKKDWSGMAWRGRGK